MHESHRLGGWMLLQNGWMEPAKYLAGYFGWLLRGFVTSEHSVSMSLPNDISVS